MSQVQDESRDALENGIMLLYLRQLNKYALEHELIPKEIYTKIERSLIQTYHPEIKTSKKSALQ